MQKAQLEVWPDPAEVGRARRWVRTRLAAAGIRGDDPFGDTLVLLVSELVTNAVVHTGRPAVVRLCLPGAAVEGRTVRLEVADASGRAPVFRCADGEATDGRGLTLVDGLADRWGWTREETGKRIWCELDHPGAPERSADHATAVPVGGGLTYETV